MGQFSKIHLRVSISKILGYQIYILILSLSLFYSQQVSAQCEHSKEHTQHNLNIFMGNATFLEVTASFLSYLCDS